MFVNGFIDSATLTDFSRDDNAEQAMFAAHAPIAPPPVALLGVVFHNVTLSDAVSHIEEMIVSRQPHYVATANVDFLVQARRDLELQRILLNAPLVLCDGTPLVWASRVLGNPLPERVAGSDLTPQLIRVAASKGYRVFFLGTTEEANTQAIAKLRAEFPDLQISHYAPPFRTLLEMDNAEIVHQIRDAQPDLLLVAFGCPKAEKWIAMHYRELGVPVCIGVGATIDFLAGRVKRAPVWMQRAGIEWVFRLCQEPRRLFKRYASDLWNFGAAIFQQWWTTRARVDVTDESIRSSVVMSEPTWLRVDAASCLSRSSFEHDASLWKKIAEGKRHCLLEASAVETIDSTGIAMLVQLQKELRASGQHLILISPSASMRNAIGAMGLESFFEIASDAVAARELIEARRQEECAVEGELTPSLAWLGEITSVNAEQVWQRTWATIDNASPEANSRIIDLAAVRFIDSVGAKLLLNAFNLARSRGVRLQFRNPSAAVRNVLRIRAWNTF